jgi:hypothetical protein
VLDATAPPAAVLREALDALKDLPGTPD